MRRRRNGSRSVVGKMGFGIDIVERLEGRPQVHVLIGCMKADGRFRLGGSLQA